MKVFPAVDILDGQCVQLVQGKREHATIYGDPLFWAKKWLSLGAEQLHVINLNGAFGNSRENAELIEALIKETGVFLQLGGGIRTISDAARWLDLGINRVILGTLAIQEPESISILSDTYGRDAVMAGVDAKGGEVVVRGWEEPAGDYISWARRFETLGAGSLLFTNVDVEGLQQGIDVAPVKKLLECTHIPVIAAGGISSADDARILKRIGVSGIVLGSALYSGKINFIEIREICR